jgi:hypothetical protein
MRQLISCHDCGKPVSLSARWCPQCGSKDLAGPIPASRTVGAQARNDRTTFLMVAMLGAFGVFYGVETGSSWIREVLGAIFYGFIGVVAAVPRAIGDSVMATALAVFGSNQVPELTRCADIQLNERVSLRRSHELLASSQSCGLA